MSIKIPKRKLGRPLAGTKTALTLITAHVRVEIVEKIKKLAHPSGNTMSEIVDFALERLLTTLHHRELTAEEEKRIDEMFGD